MDRQVLHLSRIVDDLLDVTRIARGKVQLHLAEVDLGALTRRVAEDDRALLLIRGDETRLVQVLGNLLQNAAKSAGRLQ